MGKNYNSSFVIFSIAALTFLSTSFIPLDHAALSSSRAPGFFELKVSGKHEQNISGHVVTDMAHDASNGSSAPSELRLYFTAEGAGDTDSIELILSSPELGCPLKSGSYLISENIEGLFRDFTGVFGFADLTQFGEHPYFPRRGKIMLIETGRKTVWGTLRMEMANNAGDLIHVEGNFLTKQEECSPQIP